MGISSGNEVGYGCDARASVRHGRAIEQRARMADPPDRAELEDRTAVDDCSPVRRIDPGIGVAKDDPGQVGACVSERVEDPQALRSLVDLGVDRDRGGRRGLGPCRGAQDALLERRDGTARQVPQPISPMMPARIGVPGKPAVRSRTSQS